MSSMSRQALIAKILAALLALVALAVSATVVWVGRRVPPLPGPPRLASEPQVWPETEPVPTSAWQVIHAPLAPRAPDGGPLAGRFRLAGTFFIYGADDSSGGQPRAIVDEVQKNQQTIVVEGDTLEEFTVQQVMVDRVILRAGLAEFVLTLSYAETGGPAPVAPAASTGETRVVAMEDMPALETSRFGKRVGENRWVFKREELLKYYQEVLDEPERIAKIYMSLKPDYQGENIEGYKLASEGEAEFFRAVGLQESDTIRKVNSMRMVSQRRAEYFLSEFLKNRVSALVLDIEREGKPEKLIYLIR